TGTASSYIYTLSLHDALPIFSGDSLGNMIEDMEGITSWSLDYASLKLSDENDYAKTVSTGGGRFEVRDLDGEVIWRSQWINIEGDRKSTRLNSSHVKISYAVF